MISAKFGSTVFNRQEHSHFKSDVDHFFLNLFRMNHVTLLVTSKAYFLVPRYSILAPIMCFVSSSIACTNVYRNHQYSRDFQYYEACSALTSMTINTQQTASTP